MRGEVWRYEGGSPRAAGEGGRGRLLVLAGPEVGPALRKILAGNQELWRVLEWARGAGFARGWERGLPPRGQELRPFRPTRRGEGLFGAEKVRRQRAATVGGWFC